MPNNNEGQEEWTRAAFLLDDWARVMKNGDFYDCTFEVICEKTGEAKKFKCHKLLLSISSCVFAKMLFGNFKEARLGADEAIPLHGVSSQVFECAMSFLYTGDDENFQNADLAMEVYRFAHKMQINSLMYAVNEFFTTIPAWEALKVFEFCIQLDNEHGMQVCRKLVEGKKSAAVLDSDGWLMASESVVQEVLQLDKLDVSESEVVAALLRWGCAQVEADDHKPTKGYLLRNKVASSLKFIRFAHLTKTQFTKLCKGNLGWVLSGEEKFQILNCITLKKWATVPELLQPVCLAPRSRTTLSVYLSLRRGDSESVAKEDKLSSSFSLKMNKRCCFVGLKYILAEHSAPVKPKMQPKSIKVTERKFPIYVLGQSGIVNSSQGELMLKKECTFEAGVKYTVHFTFPSIPLKTSYKTYNFGKGSRGDVHTFCNGRLEAKVYGPLVGVKVKKLIFRMLD